LKYIFLRYLDKNFLRRATGLSVPLERLYFFIIFLRRAIGTSLQVIQIICSLGALLMKAGAYP
jgi:hypothetical protein